MSKKEKILWVVAGVLCPLIVVGEILPVLFPVYEREPVAIDQRQVFIIQFVLIVAIYVPLGFFLK